ncbi:hypothetical protein D0T84_05100 [Dysgonomonas sp. 521]|uniref:hypothetical protein n=1 Tax=Dysgonomonas sp. 521 TaxID=2302932 RepID=UPI0013D488CB|nr:hypothetical protein [Dysgonomonas sp. 521]NDV94295.1 hypothetical protein [Dysgonomonas sp. 521]
MNDNEEMNGHYKSIPAFENISFESAKKIWEEDISDFIKTISPEIPFNNVEWEKRKMCINVYQTDENGFKKRGGSGYGYFAEVVLQKENVEKIWSLFEQFSNNYDLKIERWRNNEKDLDRYHFEARNDKTNDSISCNINLPNEWNNPYVSISVFVGGRYRQIDLDSIKNSKESDK